MRQFLLTIIVWLAFYLTRTETHATAGSIFFGLVATESIAIGLQSRYLAVDAYPQRLVPNP